MTTPSTQESTELVDADGEAVVNHYVPKKLILHSLVTGEPVRALCGTKWVVTSQGGGRTDSGPVICWDCDFIFSGLED